MKFCQQEVKNGGKIEILEKESSALSKDLIKLQTQLENMEKNIQDEIDNNQALVDSKSEVYIFSVNR